MTLSYGTIDVIDAVARSTVPLQVVAGKQDRLTPLEDVRIAYDVSGAREKELIVCGREHGFCADYGHVDLVFGRNAKTEIFPRIRDWFVKHDSATNGSDGHAHAPAHDSASHKAAKQRH
jgi:hypothetical protein